jgi:amino acid permease
MPLTLLIWNLLDKGVFTTASIIAIMYSISIHLLLDISFKTKGGFACIKLFYKKGMGFKSSMAWLWINALVGIIAFWVYFYIDFEPLDYIIKVSIIFLILLIIFVVCKLIYRSTHSNKVSKQE